jgi:hypothetical protein
MSYIVRRLLLLISWLLLILVLFSPLLWLVAGSASLIFALKSRGIDEAKRRALNKAIRIGVSGKTMDCERIRTDPASESRLIIAFAEIAETDLDVVFLTGEAVVLAEVRPPTRVGNAG